MNRVDVDHCCCPEVFSLLELDDGRYTQSAELVIKHSNETAIKGVRQVPKRINKAANGIPIMKEKAHVVSTMPTALDLPLKGTDAPVQVLDPTSKETFETEIAINANVKTTKPLLAP
tara:strand:- start:14322 stop:14672 length:351 start_codon:yes stop_codon:yes gene_type:complete